STSSSSTSTTETGGGNSYTLDSYWSNTSSWLTAANDGTSSNGGSTTNGSSEQTLTAPNVPIGGILELLMAPIIPDASAGALTPVSPNAVTDSGQSPLPFVPGQGPGPGSNAGGQEQSPWEAGPSGWWQASMTGMSLGWGAWANWFGERRKDIDAIRTVGLDEFGRTFRKTLRTGEAQDSAAGVWKREKDWLKETGSLGFYQAPELTPEQAAAEAPYGHGDLFMQGYYDVGDKMVVANEVAMLIGDAVTGGGLKICKAGKVLKWGVYGVRALQVAGSSYQAYNNFSNGNYVAGGLNVLQAILGVIGFRGSCFAAGTPLLTPTGEKSVEEFRPGDWILSAPEDDPTAPLEAKQVEEVFESQAVLWNLHVGGQVIQTTAEHPFWVKGKGWACARELKPGNLLRSHDGRWVAVEEIFDTGVEQPVYNLRIADYHTYFVGSPAWGFSIWAHNNNGYCVYAASAGGTASYFGRTGSFLRRAAEHARNGRTIEAIRGLGKLTYKRARALEHVLIQKYGRKGIDPGGILDNINRGIDSRKIGKYKKQIEWAEKLISSLGL
ncbi:MAG TPA: polymorphic toxin-type HINT domain-containing protein, partial [Gemmataceae bacterium]|nr:polymorphic toxin-type HINT domain-containing protein [Gemmataceae bacterium]